MKWKQQLATMPIPSAMSEWKPCYVSAKQYRKVCEYFRWREEVIRVFMDTHCHHNGLSKHLIEYIMRFTVEHWLTSTVVQLAINKQSKRDYHNSTNECV